MGGAQLDLRQAKVNPGEEVVVDVFTLMGGAVIYVPDDWIVDTRAIVPPGWHSGRAARQWTQRRGRGARLRGRPPRSSDVPPSLVRGASSSGPPTPPVPAPPAPPARRIRLRPRKCDDGTPSRATPPHAHRPRLRHDGRTRHQITVTPMTSDARPHHTATRHRRVHHAGRRAAHARPPEPDRDQTSSTVLAVVLIALGTRHADSATATRAADSGARLDVLGSWMLLNSLGILRVRIWELLGPVLLIIIGWRIVTARCIPIRLGAADRRVPTCLPPLPDRGRHGGEPSADPRDATQS